MLKRMSVYAALALLLLLTSISYGASLQVVMLGDSLTEGLGVMQEDAFPALVQEKFEKDGLQVQLMNAGVSGSTSASGPRRLKWYVKIKPDLVFLALGANDGLRGLSLEEMKQNLAKTIEACQRNSLKVVLAGMHVPPNYGEAYSTEFHQVFHDLASKYKIPLLPFLLEGVAGDPDLNQPDGIHPNEEGQKKVAKLVYEFLKPIVKEHLDAK